MERKDRNTYVLSSGREFDANHGIIGLDQILTGKGDIGPFCVTEGYDSLSILGFAEGQKDGQIVSEWTAEERAELADYMIEQWQEFKRQSAPPAQR